MYNDSFEWPSFDLPPGKHSASLSQTKLVKKPSGPASVRFIWEIPPKEGDLGYRAGKNYILAPDGTSDLLKKDIGGWLGPDVYESIIAGETTLDSLVGQSCVLHIRHKRNRGYPKPFVAVHAIKPLPPAKEAPEEGQ